MHGTTYDCQIIRAVDGDTFEVIVSLGWSVWVTSTIRINGINCSEMHDKNSAQKELASKAKQEAQKFEGKKAQIIAWGYDKYGRRVCDLRVENQDYAANMLSKNLAKPYYIERQK